MASKLPLSERLPASVRKPVELLSYSLIDEVVHFDDSVLKYYYFPLTELDREPPIDLSTGYDPATFDPTVKFSFIDSLLKGMIEYERRNGNVKTDVKLVSWRGAITKLLCLSQGNKDRNLLNEEIDFYVTGFDGQIFISHSEEQNAKQNAEVMANKDMHKFMYSGRRFEEIATLTKPWGECTRSEIENRYTEHNSGGPKEEYTILVKNQVGDIKVLFGAETDAVIDYKDPSNKLGRYIELKTTSLIKNPRHMANFERKIMKTWIQSFLAGVPKIAYGFRDHNLKLRTVEMYDTLKLPSFVTHSRVLQPQEKWNGKDITNFYAILMHWLKDKVVDGQSYRLQFKPQTTELRLAPAELKFKDRDVSFLSNEFVQWRKSL